MNRIPLARALCVGLVIAMPIVGCVRSAVNTVQPGASGEEGGPDFSKCTVSGWLDKKANVYAVHHDMDKGVLRAQLDLRNLTPMEQRVEYQFVWFDQSGNAVGQTSSHWFNLTLGAGQIKHVAEYAPTASAVDFRFEVRGRR